MNDNYLTLFGPANKPNIRTYADEDEMEKIEADRRSGNEKIKQS